MKKVLLKSISLLLVITFLFCGCTTSITTVKKEYPKGSEAQAVVAFNPAFYLDGESVTAFNDISSAISSDVKSKTLSSLSQGTQWRMISKSGSEWRYRSVYDVENWRNHDKISKGKLKAYSYTTDGSISLMCYSKSYMELKSYDDNLYPEMGVLISSSGDRQENLSYIVQNDCSLNIPSGTLTMIQTVDGIDTGFLNTEDGSDRTAIFNIMVNNIVLWSGEFGKTVGENGESVTYLEYPDFYDLPIKSGDIISFGVQLNGEKVENVYSNEEYEMPDEEVVLLPETEQEESDPEENLEVQPELKEIPFLTGYDSTFTVVYPENMSVEQKKLATSAYNKIEKTTGAEVKFMSDNLSKNQKAKYEILIGETNRSVSKDAYSKLRGYRKNYANDYLITVSGNDVVIAGGSDISLENAIDFFLTTYLEDEYSKVPTDMYHVSRPKVRSFSIDGINIKNYVIRTEKYPSILTKRAAKELSNFFITEGGIIVPVENDQKKTKNEILVGLTERSGVSAKVFKEQSLDYIKGFDAEQYEIYFKNGKLFVDAGSDYAANYAVGLIKNSLKNASNIPANYVKKGVYNPQDENTKYNLSDGYGFAWSDEFLTSKKDGTPIVNNLDYWFNVQEDGDQLNKKYNYKPDSQLIKELLLLNENDPLRKLLGKKQVDDQYGEYYPFGKVSFSGLNKSYGAKDNMMWQNTKFDIDNGFSGSSLSSDSRIEFRYGIFEARIILGTKPGATASLWFSGASGLEYRNEIDLLETGGLERLVPNLHTWGPNSYHVNHGNSDFVKMLGLPPEGEHFYDTFHYIGMEWSADFIDFYLDGEIFCSVPMTDEKWDAFEEKDRIRLSYDVSPGFYAYNTYLPGYDGGIKELMNFDATQYYDYIRIYQKNGERQRVWDYLAD